MKRLLLGISSGILYTLISIGIALFTAPYFLKFISKEEFGIFYLANNLIVWAGLMNVGLRGSFKLQLASALGKGEETKQLTTTILISQGVIAVVLSFTGFVLSFFLDSLFEIPSIVASDVRFVFILLSLSFACSLIANSFAAILSVHNRDANVYTTRSFLLVLQALLSVGLISFGWGIKGLALAALLSETAFLFYMFFLVSIQFRLASIDLSNFNSTLLLNSLSLGKWFLAGFLAQLLIRHTDLLLVGELAGLEAVTAFIFTSKFYLLAAALLQMTIKIITPQMIRMMQSESTMNSSKMTLLFLKFILGFVLIGGTGIYIFNELFISWWIGPSYYLGDEINLLMMLAFFFTSLNLAGRALFAANMQWKAQKISELTEGFLHLSLSALLGILYGLKGIVAGIALSAMLASFISFIPLLSMNKNLAGMRGDALGIFSYICIVSLVLLALPASPAIEKNFLALSTIAGTFILLFLKDLWWIFTKITGTTIKRLW